MKVKLILMGFLTMLFGCGHKSLLSENEIKICNAISFDQELAEMVKKETQRAIEQIPQVSELGEILNAKGMGLCSEVAEQSGYEFVLREKERFRSKGYLLFLFENDSNQKFLGVVKGVNELDIVTWRQTNGINYDHENADVVAKLQLWKQQNDFVVMGVSRDWVQFQFVHQPKDVETIAQEVYEFCPDAIDQGAGDMPTLIQMIRELNGVYLWWD